jgi:hypothetical protein
MRLIEIPEPLPMYNPINASIVRCISVCPFQMPRLLNCAGQDLGVLGEFSGKLESEVGA